MSSLLLIHLQQDFLKPKRISSKPLIDSLPHLLRQFTARRRPIVWIDSGYEQSHEASEEDTPSKGPPQSDYELYLSGTHRSGRFCVHGTPGVQIHEKLLPFLHAHHTRITKTYYSSFTNTDIHDNLQQTDTKHIFLAGVTTYTCVSATAIDARKLGYEVTIVEDCVKAFKHQTHDQAILTLTGSPHNVTLCSSSNISSHLDDGKPEPLPVVYWVNGFIPSWRVMIALAQKKIPYVSKRLKVMSKPKETRSPAFALINPRCETLTFIDSDGTTVIESMAILQYLERFYQGTPADRPIPLSKSEWTQETPIELLYDPDWQNHRDGILQSYQDIFKELEHWERYLTSGAFLSARNAFGLADCAFYPILAYMVHRGLDLAPNFPSLNGYYKRCGALQAVLEASPDHWEKPGKSLFLKCEKMLED